VYDWPRRHPLVVDATLSGALFVVLVLPLWIGARSAKPSDAAVAVAAIASVMVLALAARRRQPVLTFTVVALCCLLQLAVRSDPVAADLAFVVATYSLAAHATSRRLRLAGLGVAVLAGALAAVSWSDGVGAGTPIFGILAGGVAVTAWIAGDLMRNRRAVLSALQAQNEALRRDQEQRAGLAAQQERARIAREMHDVVAHGLSVIVVQAEGAAWAARHGSTWQRDEAIDTLEVLATTARAALTETRHLVGLLGGEDDGSAPDGREGYAPVAGLRDLPGLVERVRDAGLDVRLESPVGDQPDVPTETSLAAYRIAQESLTNVLKHGGPGARATVALTRIPDGLRLVVTDDGQGAAAEPAPLGGRGMVGMRQRANAVGGRLEAGPRAEGGFRVAAHLPLPEAPA
jgi:signal transduction histidine kinase